MRIAIITGAGGLVGSACCKLLASQFDLIIGIDNNQRAKLFGNDGSVLESAAELSNNLHNFHLKQIDIREKSEINNIFQKYGDDIKLIVHAAAQPSHDWSAKDPYTDYTINAVGSINMLEAFRKHTPAAVFVHLSTNKVYGDRPNYLPLEEQDTRWELERNHQYFQGVNENMNVDNCVHSPFGASKLSADVTVQEYGKYFGLKTVIFRAGCITGSNHQAAVLHGFLAYLVRCIVEGKEYTIYGYKGKQVRDNIHAEDLSSAIWNVFEKPPTGGTVYNIGGSRFSNCSIIEAVEITRELISTNFNPIYSDINRVGDHIWWISDNSKFKSDYPNWSPKFDTKKIIEELATYYQRTLIK